MTSYDFLHRRSFLRHLTGAAFGLAGAGVLKDLRLIQSALAQSPPNTIFSDYRALVCLFLSGGNDANNLIIPYTDDEYTSYAAARSELALAKTAATVTTQQPYYILPLSTAQTSGRPFGVHSACPELKTLFDSGKLSFVANVGTLVEPVTKAQYSAGTRRLPPQLFSHNDQVVQWQTSIPDQISTTGWGGRMADLLKDSVWQAPANNPTANRISLSISAAGFNTWQVGNHEHLYQVGTAGSGSNSGGAKTLSGFNSTFAARTQKIRDIIALGQNSGQTTNLFQRDFTDVFDRAVDAADTLNAGLSGISAANNAIINGAFDPLLVNTQPGEVRSLAGQMKMIAKLIAARSTSGLDLKRQLFYCQLGGFDTHGGQLTSQPNLLAAVSRNLSAFQSCMEQLAVSSNVTTFTASDFGRTLPSNGYGSDHGWGTHAMVMGGAVQGGRVLGTFPTLTIGGPDDTSLGRWIPTTAVDQYAASLARWLGVTESNLDVILPNLGRFASRNIGIFS